MQAAGLLLPVDRLETSNVSQMVNAINSAVSAGVDGIAIALIDPHAFNAPTTKALAAGIPVVAYNADVSRATPGWPTSARTCSCPGRRWAQHIAQLVPSGDVALFIATPGSLNIQPRIDGAKDTLKSHPSITHAHHRDRAPRSPPSCR